MSDKLAHRRSGALQLETQEVSFAEARSNQAGKWLLFGVTRRNDADEPTHGYLLYADPREYSVTCKLKALATEPGIVYSGFALLFAEPATTVAAARGDAN